ncbi:YncE family protein [uncultured Leclercia sp.]|uniref:YncE family protein n=1 Tax=uncultured Leclercia sp. TaxID=332959 RepID=UPI0025976842|nr:YncE family protein [uncultured Leclercia sp.]
MNRSRLSLQLAGLCLATLIPTLALAIDPPARELTRFALSTNYLEDANEGLYELAYDNSGRHLFVAVTDRMNRAANKGFLYTFNPETLAVEQRLEMPYRAFSLALAPTRHRLYVGHTQSASLRISLLDSETGKLLNTSDKLSFNLANAADARFEHLRHMVYSPAYDTLFVSYSNMLKSGEGMQPVHKLLMLDGATLALKGEVEGAYSGTAYGLTLDDKTQKIYVGGRDYINEIDAKTQKVQRTLALKNVKPQISSVQNLAVDSASQRAFVVVFNHEDRSGPDDGLYIFDLRDGKQLGFVHTGAGANAVKYNPKYNELYVTNFTSGTLSVIDAKNYKVTREFVVPVYPNQMALSVDMDTLFVGIKEGFNREWDPDVFVKGAKERILRIELNKS